MDIKETLPKSGHVHEVCKEWLVREDGALAYRLQSQEINEFYQGNKFRNAVVRQDFPTALHEQIKEKETAEEEAARYQQLLKEQEQADKDLAEKIANKLAEDEQLHLKQLEESEIIARQMQDTYVNLNANNQFLQPVSSVSLCLPKTSEFDNKHFDSLERSDNLLCERLEKLHCRPKKEILEKDYEQYLDVANNIRNADIHPQQRNFNSEGPFQMEICMDNNIIKPVRSQMPSRKHLKLTGKHIRNSLNSPEMPMQLNLPKELEELNDLSLSPDDFEEINRKLQQEKSDEELARHLQKEEQRRSLSQEEKDRLLAIEAQDKELAIMLQEREKSKAKRAREKARLKKLQAKELTDNSKLPIVNEPYSNPRDLITDSNIKYHSRKSYDFPVIDNTEHEKTHNSNTEDIYTLPIDNPNHEMNSRSSDEMATSLDSRTTALSSPSVMRLSYHQTSAESSPKPPYMPIHDIGSNLPLEGRKKKSKDKCTHQ